jgi:glutamate-1-semialdehyde 2,1-aminomutase
LPANAGLIPPRPGFLEHLRKKTSEQGTVLIFDEVMTGFRLGKAGAQGIFGVTPDLSAFGKVIGGGLPVGAFGGKAAIMDFLAPLGPVYQAGTLSGNPVAMAAGLAQLKALEQNDAFGRLEQCGAELEKGIRGLLLRKGLDWTFYRYGSMCCLFFTPHAVHTLEDAKTSDTAAFASFFHKMLDAGVYLPPSQFETWFLSLAHGPGELETTLKAMEQAL